MIDIHKGCFRLYPILSPQLPGIPHNNILQQLVGGKPIMFLCFPSASKDHLRRGPPRRAPQGSPSGQSQCSRYELSSLAQELDELQLEKMQLEEQLASYRPRSSVWPSPYVDLMEPTEDPSSLQNSDDTIIIDQLLTMIWD